MEHCIKYDLTCADTEREHPNKGANSPYNYHRTRAHCVEGWSQLVPPQTQFLKAQIENIQPRLMGSKYPEVNSN